MQTFIDLPGIYDLHGYSEDEEVVRAFLNNTPLDAIVLILNSAQIDRQISLAIQVQRLEVPTILMLNMVDEGLKFGVSIDAARLSQQLEMPVFPISAKYSQGYELAILSVAETIATHEMPFMAKLQDTVLSQDELTTVIDKVLHGTLQSTQTSQDHRTQRLDRILLHPVLGLPLFFGYLIDAFMERLGLDGRSGSVPELLIG